MSDAAVFEDNAPKLIEAGGFEWSIIGVDLTDDGVRCVVVERLDVNGAAVRLWAPLEAVDTVHDAIVRELEHEDG